MKLTLAAALVLTLCGNAAAKGGHFKGCNAAQKAAITEAAGEAMRRLWVTKTKYAGIGMAMDERQAEAIEAQRRAAVMVEHTIFGKNDTDISFYITGMYVNLMETNRDVRCQPASDKECGVMREAYVRSADRSVIHLCPSFFKYGAEQRARAMVHEAAHTAGISESSGGESYCTHITCDGGCGDAGTKVADNWSAFVYCASGQTPDQGMAVTGSVSVKPVQKAGGK